MTASRLTVAIPAALTLASGGGSATGPSSAVAGKWSGITPDGMIIEVINGHCPRSFDVEFNFSSNTGGEIGTATTRLRETPCPDVLNGVHTYNMDNGNVTADSISFEFTLDRSLEGRTIPLGEACRFVVSAADEIVDRLLG